MSLRRTVFWLHLLCGTTAGVVISIMSATGVLLAFEPQLVEWTDRDVRRVAPPAPGATRLGLDALLAKVREARPDARPMFISVRSAPDGAVSFGFSRDDSLFVDPYTGAITGGGSAVQRTLRLVEDWHRWLGSRDVGRPITGACNAAFVGLVLTGAYLWWPRAWSRQAVGAITWFKRGLTGRARDFNWHNTIGVWCAPVLLVISLTGLVMSYQWANDLLYRLAGSEPPPAPAGPGPAAPAERGGAPRREGRGGGEARREPSLDPLLARAEERVPGWVAITMRFAPRPSGPVNVFITEPPSWHPAPRSQLTLDPATGEVVRWEPYAAQSLGRRLRAWARVLHTGEAGRVGGQVIALVASAGGTVLVWTGIALAWRRWRAWSARRRRPADAPDVAVPSEGEGLYRGSERPGPISASSSSSREP